MKKIFLILLLAISVFCFTSCQIEKENGEKEEPTILEEAKIEIGQIDGTVIFYNESKDTLNLTATLTNGKSGDTIKWKSTNEEVATVDNSGNVSILSDGSCKIKAYLNTDESVYSEKQFTFIYLQVSITNKIEQLDIYEVSDYDMLYSVESHSQAEYQDFVWNSSDENVATIEDGKISLHQKGLTVISISKNDCDYVYDSVMLKVKDSTDDIEEEELSKKIANIKYRNYTTVYGDPTLSLCKEDKEIIGLNFGAKTIGEQRVKFKTDNPLQSGHKYVFSYKITQVGTSSVWGNFSIGLLDVVTCGGGNITFSPSMWGYANNSNSDSHAVSNAYAKNVTLTGSHVENDYEGSAEFIMIADKEEVWLDLRMTNAVLGNNVLITELKIEEDTSYFEAILDDVKLAEKMIGIKTLDATIVYGSPKLEIYKEDSEVSGLYFGAKSTGEQRVKFKTDKPLQSGHKYVFSYKITQVGTTDVWGNFSIGLLDVVTCGGALITYSPTMWGYANNANSDSHATSNAYAKNVMLTGSHVEKDYVGSAEFIMIASMEEVWLDLRMTNAVVGNNVLITELKIEEDQSYFETLQKDEQLKTLLNGITVLDAVKQAGSPVLTHLVEGDSVVGLKVGSSSTGEIREYFTIDQRLEEGHTYKLSFTVNKVGSVGLWGNLMIGLLEVVTLPSTNKTYSPSMWGYANNSDSNSHAVSNEYAENVKLTGSPSSSTTFNETATFTMLKDKENFVIDVRMTNCVAEDLFTITALTVEDITE